MIKYLEPTFLILGYCKYEKRYTCPIKMFTAINKTQG